MYVVYGPGSRVQTYDSDLKSKPLGGKPEPQSLKNLYTKSQQNLPNHIANDAEITKK